ncbi:hypothetical protein EDC30_11832 [Paucimonas lemoignei]|uniref:Uncharacterized protein n=1 Tax=Paucimonas lemoignei TaxID=29443 RepID=A0A4R3HSC9_PAULE|nr:hypothetical protein [Paucimonas lemoignei]TCS33091.1 hypothetical protein EDC30_11832 [Paucimonas lemoignei]
MEPHSALASKVAIILVAAAFMGMGNAAAAATQEQHQQQHHPESTAPQKSKGKAGDKGIMMSSGDMKSMCEMHEQMMGAKYPEEQKAIMAEHMNKMSPQMRQQHMEMMRSHMQMMQEYMKNQPRGK